MSTTKSSDAIYLEVGWTLINLQKKAEPKPAILHKGKEKRCPDGANDAKKLKNR